MRRLAPSLAGICLVFAAHAVEAQEALVLLSPSAGAAPAATRQAIRQRRVDVPGAARVMSADASQRLQLDLFPDVTLRATRQRLEPTASGMAWFGTVDGYPLSDVVIVQVGDELMGNIFTPFGLFHIGREGGVYVVQQVDLDALPVADDAVAPPETPAATAASIEMPALTSPDTGSLIDVLVVYTRDALSGWGTETRARTAIDLAIAQTNQAFRNSDINTSVRLAHVQMVDYAESGTSATDLSRLQARGDGHLDDVHSLRDGARADLVVLITERMTDAAGRGYLNGPLSRGETGFSNVSRISTGGTTLAHELGHNLGAHHDWFETTSPGAFRFSKGYTSVAGRFHDVMAYRSHCAALRLPCTTVLHYSNPRINRDGHATGIPEGTKLTCVAGDPNQVDCDADAAATLNRMAQTVARFRQGSPSIMSAGQRLLPGESMLSDSGAYRLSYQGDGNLVLTETRSGLPLWATNTEGRRPGFVTMQSDGNLVIYDADGRPRWSSRTDGNPYAYLFLLGDGNLAIVRPEGGAIWDRHRR